MKTRTASSASGSPMFLWKMLTKALIVGSVAVFTSCNEQHALSIKTTKAKISGISVALTSYKVSNGSYPTQEQGLEALVTRPKTAPLPAMWQPMVSPESIIDEWNHKLVYRIPGKHNLNGFDLYSLGPDGLKNTGDDFGNW